MILAIVFAAEHAASIQRYRSVFAAWVITRPGEHNVCTSWNSGREKVSGFVKTEDKNRKSEALHLLREKSGNNLCFSLEIL